MRVLKLSFNMTYIFIPILKEEKKSYCVVKKVIETHVNKKKKRAKEKARKKEKL